MSSKDNFISSRKRNMIKELSYAKSSKTKTSSQPSSSTKIQTKRTFENELKYKDFTKKQLFLKNIDKKSEFIKSSISNLDSTFREYSRNINKSSNPGISSNLYNIFLERTNLVQNQFSKVNKLAKTYKFNFYDSLNLSYFKENQQNAKKKKTTKKEIDTPWENDEENININNKNVKHQKLHKLKDFLFNYEIEEVEKKIVTPNEEQDEKNDNCQSFLRKNLINKNLFETSVHYDKMKLSSDKKYALILDNMINIQNNNNKSELNSKLYQTQNKLQNNSNELTSRPKTTRDRNNYNEIFNLKNKTNDFFNLNKGFKKINNKPTSAFNRYKYKKYNLIPFLKKKMNNEFQKLINKTLRNCKYINKEISLEKKNKYKLKKDDSLELLKNKKELDIKELRKELKLKNGNLTLDEGEIIMKNVKKMKKILSKDELHILNQIAKTVILEDKRANNYLVLDDKINFKLRLLNERTTNKDLMRKAMKIDTKKEFSVHDRDEFAKIMKNEYYDFNDLKSLKQILLKYKQMQKPY